MIDYQPTPEQQRLGNRCRVHAEMVMAMTSANDINGALDYLRHVEDNDGTQMRRNVTDLVALTLAILPPEAL